MEPIRYSAAACQTDLPNPLNRKEMKGNTDRMLAMVDSAMAGAAPFLPVRLVVFPEFAHAAPVYPTLAELSGTGPVGPPALVPFNNAPTTLDGNSFAELAYDPTAAGPDTVFSEYALRSTNAQYMVRDRQYKYVHNGSTTPELYDLTEDPGENRNLATTPGMGETLERLHRDLLAHYDPATNPFGASADVDPTRLPGSGERP